MCIRDRKGPENVPFALRYWACNKSTLELRSIEAEAAKAKALCLSLIHSSPP